MGSLILKYKIIDWIKLNLKQLKGDRYEILWFWSKENE